MKKIFTLTLLLASVFCCAMAQQNTDRPGWTYNTPKAGNNTYVYVVERGGGTTVNEAINNALLKVLRTTMMRIGAVVSWDEVNSSLQQGTDWGTVAMKYNIPVNKVCECVEQKTEKGYRVAVLCQVAKSGNAYPDFDEFTGCNDVKTYSNSAALVKSIFLPGLGQMGKRRSGSGIFTLMGEVVLVGGAVGSYYMANQELSVIQDAQTSLNGYKSAKENYNMWRTVNIASLSAAAALYVWNLYRAYTITPKFKKDKNSLSFYPTLMPVEDELSAGVGLTLNF